jgi:hypothetical protein
LQYAVLLHLRSFAVLALALVFLAFVVIIANVINLRTLGKKQLLAQRWQILWAGNRATVGGRSLGGLFEME